jgi:hypothetical protein
MCSRVGRCLTQAGVGRNLLWTVRLEGQASVPEPGMPVPTSSYQLPIITSLVPAIRGVNPATDYTTAGGTRLVLSGTSFGPPGVDIRMLFGSMWDSCLNSKAGCM